MDISYSCSKVRKTKTKTIRSGNAASKMRKKKDTGGGGCHRIPLSDKTIPRMFLEPSFVGFGIF